MCAAASDGDDDRLAWLLFIGAAGAMPDPPRLASFTRLLRRQGQPGFMDGVLDLCGRTAIEWHSQLRALRVETEKPIVVVDFVARHGFNSGVQRVTREVARRWNAEGVTFVAMHGDSAFRDLDADEGARVHSWRSQMYDERSETWADPHAEVVVPWNTTVVLLEVPNSIQSSVISALAHRSGNRTVAVGYDTIPISSASLVSAADSINHAAYLNVLRHVDKVVAISASAEQEFAGFKRALAAQGLRGPSIEHLLLPVQAIPSEEAQSSEPAVQWDPTSSERLVLAVGSHEPRKNHFAIVYAAERLWREGLEFSLMLVGGRGPDDYTDVHDAVVALRRIGRRIDIRNSVSDEALAAAYASARCSVFLSLHEGFGLPVAESLAAGTPVLTTEYGSTAEIAAAGGCVLVNPRDDDAIRDAMRAMITDDELIVGLRKEIATRIDTTWDDFARDLWRLAISSEASVAE
ncbi:hypothetical protein ASG80_04355 [Agromyces sp. Soil535]|nr:hypothetical protein ASG80_04355 [Agromyces sp. Soil535]